MKKILVLFLIAISPLLLGAQFQFDSPTAYWDYTKDASCVGAWRMNLASGSTEADLTSNANNLTYSSAGVPGGYYSHADGGSLDINGSSAKFTIVTWLNMYSLAQNTTYGLVTKYGIATDQRQYALLAFTADVSNPTTFKIRVACSHSYTVGTSPSTTADSADLNPNTRYHIAAVYNGSNITIYVNGVASGTPTTYSSGIFNGSNAFYVASYNDHSSVYSPTGSLDDVGVFSRALSTAEINAIMNYGLQGRGIASYIAAPAPPVGATYAASNTAMTALCAANSTWTCRSFGNSANGNAINGVIIAEAGYNHTVLIDARIHGYDLEDRATMAALAWLNYLSNNKNLYRNTRWIVIPVDNPDGVIANTRKNNNTGAGRSVDLNRNDSSGWDTAYVLHFSGAQSWSTDPASIYYIGPSAASEPETTVLNGVITTYAPDVQFSVHAYLDMIIGTTGQTSARRDTICSYLTVQGFSCPSWDYGDAAGQFRNYSYSQGVESYEFEMGAGFYWKEVNKFIAAMKSVAESF